MSRLGEILVERGAVTLEEVARARDEQQAGERLGDALVRLSIASPFDVAGALAELSGVALCDLREEEPTKEALDAVPTRFVFRSNLLPLARDNGTLVVGTSDPFGVSTLPGS